MRHRSRAQLLLGHHSSAAGHLLPLQRRCRTAQPNTKLIVAMSLTRKRPVSRAAFLIDARIKRRSGLPGHRDEIGRLA